MSRFNRGFLNTQLAFTAWVRLLFVPYSSFRRTDFYLYLNNTKFSQWGWDD
jgi:hypothetical protein